MTLTLQHNDPVTLKDHSDKVWSVAFSPSDQLLASASSDRTVRLWDAESGANIGTLKGHSNIAVSVAFSPDPTILASGGWDRLIKLWDIESRAETATLKGHSDLVHSIAFSSEGGFLVSGSGDNTVRLWDIRSRTSTSTLKGHSSGVRSIAISPDGKRIASGSNDKTIQLWDIASGTSVVTLSGHTSIVASVAFSGDGEHLASGSGSGDKTIRLWNATSGAYIAALKGHSDLVNSVAFSPNSKYLASGSYDDTIRLWDVKSKSHIYSLEDHSKDVNSVVFSYDGLRLASASDDLTIRIWSFSPEAFEDATFTSDSFGLTQSSMYSQQDPIDLSSTSLPLNIDITGSVSLQDGAPIGYGGFGDLYLGTHKDRGKVALKKSRRVLDEVLIRRFLREVSLWCSVSHPHVLACLGMCKIGAEVYVVSPFIENGDLLSCMAGGKDLNRSKLLFEVAEALTHLHHRGIVHGDVKAQNVLLADDGSALLCDFGLAKAFDTMATSTEAKGAGSVRWMAPELFLGESRSMASDVYSLGITIAEVLSGRTPYENMTESLAVMFHVINADGRPPKEPLNGPGGKSYAILWDTAEKCWGKDVKARPSMAQVLGMLFPLTRE